MNRSKWMLVLLAGGLAGVVCALAQTGGSTTPSSTSVTYDSSLPDIPFVGAWDGDQPDCSDPDAETDCWKCEKSSSGNSAFPVPKYWYETDFTCPTFSMSNTVQSNCYCVLVGGKLTDIVSADYTAKDGRKHYESSIECCGGEPPEAEAITQNIEWNWTTAGLATEPASGHGQAATFEYTVPKGAFAIDVSFSAKAIPSDTNCPEITAGPEVIGKITGAGYEKYVTAPTPRAYPKPEYVEGMIVGSTGQVGFGSSYMKISQNLECKPVCENSSCPLYRLEGKFGPYEINIKVVSCIMVTVTGCDQPLYPLGSCKPRSDERKKETLAHEQKHLDLWWDFIDEWNMKVENFSLFDSCDFANKEKDMLIAEFTIARIEMNKRQDSHCPDFAGDPYYNFNGCGTEFFTDKYKQCP